MSFTLYNAPQSTCSQRVRFVLNAKHLAFDEVKLDLLAGDQLKPDYLALNPNGVVPTLDHDGAIVINSSVIIEYLDEIAPAPETFTPRDPVLRAKMRALMRFIDEMPAAAVRVPTFNLAFLPRFAAMSEEEFIAFAKSKPLRKEFMLAMGRKGFPQKDMDTAMQRLRRTYERMDAEIEHSGGPWLLGSDITLADIAVMPAIVRMADLGQETAWRDLPRVAALVRGHSRSSGVHADLLSGLAAHRAVSASARESETAIVGVTGRPRASATSNSGHKRTSRLQCVMSSYPPKQTFRQTVKHVTDLHFQARYSYPNCSLDDLLGDGSNRDRHWEAEIAFTMEADIEPRLIRVDFWFRVYSDSLVNTSTALRMSGVAERTKGIIVADAMIHDFSQWLMKIPSYINGALAIAAAIAHVKPD